MRRTLHEISVQQHPFGVFTRLFVHQPIAHQTFQVKHFERGTAGAHGTGRTGRTGIRRSGGRAGTTRRVGGRLCLAAAAIEQVRLHYDVPTFAAAT
jgi:hypothetical protein